MADSTNTTDRGETVDRVVLENARAAATAIAYQEIAQSMVLAVQSSVQHLQGLFTVNIATTGAVFSQILDGGENPDELEGRLKVSQQTVQAGIKDLRDLVEAAAVALEHFPSGNPPAAAERSKETAASSSTRTSVKASSSAARKATQRSRKTTTAQKKSKS